MYFKFSNSCTGILIILLVLVVLYKSFTEPELFRSGVQTQLMTSRPYYGWYDYINRSRNFQNYYNRRYPDRNHPYLQNWMHWWQ
jgi:hypothetical protein